MKLPPGSDSGGDAPSQAPTPAENLPWDQATRDGIGWMMNGVMLLAQTWICCVCLIRLHFYFCSGRHRLNEVKTVFHWCMLISALGCAQVRNHSHPLATTRNHSTLTIRLHMRHHHNNSAMTATPKLHARSGM